jgi:hypothetical protein
MSDSSAIKVVARNFAVVAVVAASAFLAGALYRQDRANRFLDEICSRDHPGANARHLVSLFNKQEGALEALAKSDLPQVGNLLQSLTQDIASQILSCKRDPECLRLLGSSPPDDAALEKIVFANVRQVDLGARAPSSK